MRSDVKRGLILALTMWTGLSACGAETDAGTPAGEALGPVGADQQTAPGGAVAPGGVGATPGVTGAAPGALDGAGTPTAPTAGVASAPATGDSFCQVQTLMQTRCGMCHAETTAFGAPMSLVSHADMLANAPISNQPAYMAVIQRAKDDVRPMPPVPNPRLTEEELAIIDAWVAAGTPDGQCDAGGAGAVTAGAGGAANDPNCIDCGDYVCDPAEGEPLQILAHGQPVAGDTSPYDASTVGSTGNPDLYQCFYFKAPWGQGAQSIGYKPIIDNSRVLHHWLLYASPEAPLEFTEGGMAGACQAQGDINRVLLAGWAPGTPGINFPQDVGQRMPTGSNAFITLEIHYYNTDPGKEAMDRSGVEFCMAKSPRPNVAAQHWLGTEAIQLPPGQMSTVEDTCSPTTGQMSTIISLTPHMHKNGVHGKMEVIRADGSVEVIHDKPFDFDNQVTYMLPEPVTIMPGDQIKSTCTFMNSNSNMVTFGESSDEEMCYFFTTAYPAGSLHNGKIGCLIPGTPTCVPGGVSRCINAENLGDWLNAL